MVGGLSIKSSPIRLNIDTFEARNSVVPTTARSIQDGAEKGKQAAYQATATTPSRGSSAQSADRTGNGHPVCCRCDGAGCENECRDPLYSDSSRGDRLGPGELNIRFEMDKMNFDWRLNRHSLNFVPGDIEISVTQYPDVVIKYIGGPLYVPPSADPNYEPVDVKA